MMIAVEYLNVLTRGAWPETLANSRWRQYLAAVVVGATPGCLGAFVVVALYTHCMVSCGAVVACMIAIHEGERRPGHGWPGAIPEVILCRWNQSCFVRLCL